TLIEVVDTMTPTSQILRTSCFVVIISLNSLPGSDQAEATPCSGTVVWMPLGGIRFYKPGRLGLGG
ncbi:MAG: hypothetical protein QF402_04305, partial [Candidatus Latescibacteria bacterium]|nr:hypothetical protein [Candidatus Latescibacterota bacterium]